VHRFWQQCESLMEIYIFCIFYFRIIGAIIYCKLLSNRLDCLLYEELYFIDVFSAAEFETFEAGCKCKYEKSEVS